MALVISTSIRPANGNPGDVLSVSSPVLGDEPQKAAPIEHRDASVATKTGALQYSYAIKVPPGRNGMEPSLGLSYSSQGPIYGGIASGWSLSIPIITEDTTQGRLSATAPKRYMSSMAGGRPLIPVSEPKGANAAASFRAQSDSGYVRYELMNSSSTFKWRAYSPDGKIYTFGDAENVSCSTVSDEYAPLTRVSDAFGNTVDYTYESPPWPWAAECRIKAITWGQNSHANIAAFASATFTYASAPPICDAVGSRGPNGSQSSYRTGTKILTGVSELDSITVVSFPGSSGFQVG